MAFHATRPHEPMMTIFASPFEIIVLNAAIKHYIDSAQQLPVACQEALPLLRQFQQRIVDHLPSHPSHQEDW